MKLRRAPKRRPLIEYHRWVTVPNCYTVTDRVTGTRFVVRRFDAGWAIAPYPPIYCSPTFSTEVHPTRNQAVGHWIATHP